MWISAMRKRFVKNLCFWRKSGFSNQSTGLEALDGKLLAREFKRESLSLFAFVLALAGALLVAWLMAAPPVYANLTPYYTDHLHLDASPSDYNISSHQNGNTLTLDLDFLSSGSSHQHHLNYWVLDDRTSCSSLPFETSWVGYVNNTDFSGGVILGVGDGSGTVKDYDYSYQIPLVQWGAKVCVVLVRSLHPTALYHEKVISIDKTPPTIRIDRINSPPVNPAVSNFQATVTDRPDHEIDQQSWRHWISSNSNCTDSYNIYDESGKTANNFVVKKDYPVWLPSMHLCFSVRDTSGNLGWAARTLTGLPAKPGPPVLPPPAPPTPDIEIYRHTILGGTLNTEIQARDNNVKRSPPSPTDTHIKQWYYQLVGRESNCETIFYIEAAGRDADKKYVDITILQSRLGERPMDEGLNSWICIKAVNNAGGVGYIHEQVKRGKKWIHVTQVLMKKQNKVRITAHTDSNVARWKYSTAGSAINLGIFHMADICSYVPPNKDFDITLNRDPPGLAIKSMAPSTPPFDWTYMCIEMLPVGSSTPLQTVIRILPSVGSTTTNGLSAADISCPDGRLTLYRLDPINSNSNVKLELKIWNPTLGSYIDPLAYSNYDGNLASTPPGAIYNTWHEVGNHSPGRTIATIFDGLNKRFVHNYEDYEVHWTGLWRIGNGPVKDTGNSEILTQLEGMRCGSQPIRKAVIRGISSSDPAKCRVYFEELHVERFGIRTSPPAIHLSTTPAGATGPIGATTHVPTQRFLQSSLTPPQAPTPIDIINFSGANQADLPSLVSDVKTWTWEISSYYIGSSLHYFKDYNPVNRQFFDASVNIDVNLSNWNCPAPPPEACPLLMSSLGLVEFPGAPGTYPITQTMSYTENISYSTLVVPRRIIQIPDPNNPLGPPINFDTYAVRSASGDLKFETTYKLEISDLEQMLNLASIGRDEVDTNSSLTTARTGTVPNHPALLKVDFSDRELRDGSSRHTFSRTLASAADPILHYQASLNPTYELRITNIRARRIVNQAATLPYITGSAYPGVDKQFSINDPTPYSLPQIQAYVWEVSWELDISQKFKSYFDHYGVYPYTDGNYPNGEAYTILAPNVISAPQTITFSGTWNTCSRSLIVKPPTCRISYSPLRNQETYSWEIAGERFDPNNPNALIGSIGRVDHDEIFPVGRDFARTQVRVANHNPFDLKSDSNHHPTFDVNALSPYSSASNPYNGESTFENGNIIIGRQGSSNNVKYYREPKNAINLPGKYQTSWTVKWKTDIQAGGQNWPGTTSADWNGGEHEDNECMTGHQLDQIIYVYADPPTCSVKNFLFEVGKPVLTSVTLRNPNHAPMNILSSNWTISRGSLLRTGSAPSIQIGGPDYEETLDGNVVTPTIPGTGKFTAEWSIVANMGAETWTTLDNPTLPRGQNSWFEDHDERITDGGILCESTENRVVRKPFVKIFYGSLLAGGQFGGRATYNACGDNFLGALGGDQLVNSFIAGHVEGSGPTARGSSVQYSLQAHNIIDGFYSASQRGSDPQPLKGLTLSNTASSLTYGGNFDQKTCIANYWRNVEKIDVEDPNPSPLALDLNSLQDNDRKRYKLDNLRDGLKVSSATRLDNLKATIYVEGDVYITSNIINDSTGRWHDPSEIGYITIIARGDINIAPDVERIDALLVAYPRLSGGTDGGVIRTCYYDSINAQFGHFRTCDRQLTINGALVAEKVLLGRVYGSVNLETNYPANPSNTEAAEIINLLPEYFVGVPELPLFPDQIYKTDSVSTRPANF